MKNKTTAVLFLAGVFLKQVFGYLESDISDLEIEEDIWYYKEVDGHVVVFLKNSMEVTEEESFVFADGSHFDGIEKKKRLCKKCGYPRRCLAFLSGKKGCGVEEEFLLCKGCYEGNKRTKTLELNKNVFQKEKITPSSAARSYLKRKSCFTRSGVRRC
ncbi:MAG: uncharacterized protein A8A55_2704 [Amphiamblys sp. WSBS2006]|nr:MAG: uncharacterized protein A8A55_2704 [Amphiamblys sp. WSBS2006]